MGIVRRRFYTLCDPCQVPHQTALIHANTEIFGAARRNHRHRYMLFNRNFQVGHAVGRGFAILEANIFHNPVGIGEMIGGRHGRRSENGSVESIGESLLEQIHRGCRTVDRLAGGVRYKETAAGDVG